MIILVWIAFGFIAGLIASRLFHHTGSALALDMALGAIGAVAGGAAFNSLGALQPAAFITVGLIGAAIGSVAILSGYRSIFRRA